jgi:hypothetical protein
MITFPGCECHPEYPPGAKLFSVTTMSPPELAALIDASTAEPDQEQSS